MVSRVIVLFVSEREMIQRGMIPDPTTTDSNGNASTVTNGNGIAVGSLGLGIGDTEEGKEWKEGDDIDVDVLLTPSEDGERTVFENTIRAQHLHEVQQLLGHLEDQLTVGAAPGVLIRASKFLQICQGFNQEISAKDVIHVLNLAPEPHHDQRKEDEGNAKRGVIKSKSAGIGDSSSGTGSDNGPKSDGTESSSATAGVTACTADVNDGDKIPKEAAAAMATGAQLGPSATSKQTPRHWHGLTTKNFAKKSRTVLVDINALVHVMKQKG
jgi:hypothetical protein